VVLPDAAHSAEGGYLLSAEPARAVLVVRAASAGSALVEIPLVDDAGMRRTASDLAVSAPRDSFLVAFDDLAELWEINYADAPPKGFGQWIHDHRDDSGELPVVQRFPVRRIRLAEPLTEIQPDSAGLLVLGAERDGDLVAVDLDLGRVIGVFALPQATLAEPAFTRCGSGGTVRLRGPDGALETYDVESVGAFLALP